MNNHYIGYDNIDSKTTQSKKYDESKNNIDPKIIDNEEYIERINTILSNYEENNI